MDIGQAGPLGNDDFAQQIGQFLIVADGQLQPLPALTCN